MPRAAVRKSQPRRAAARQAMSDSYGDGEDPDFVSNEDEDEEIEFEQEADHSGLDEQSVYDSVEFEDDNIDDICDIEEQIWDLRDIDALHNGNLHPPEYYLKGIENFDVTEYRRKRYAKGTEDLICHAENQWRSYVLYPGVTILADAEVQILCQKAARDEMARSAETDQRPDCPPLRMGGLRGLSSQGGRC